MKRNLIYAVLVLASVVCCVCALSACNKNDETDDGYVFYKRNGATYLTDYKGLETELTLPDSYNGSVYHIGTDAFKDNEKISVITIPEGIKRIGSSAFENCKNLESVTIPDSIKNIGDSAFKNCNAIKRLTCPAEALQSVSRKNLVSVEITSGEEIPDYAFEECSKLKSVIIADSIKDIGNFDFYGCNAIEDLTCSAKLIKKIPKKSLKSLVVTSGAIIEESALNGCEKLSSVILPDSLTTIGRFAFDSCGALTELTVPNNVTSIEEFAFADCTKLLNITLPDGLKTIESYAFCNCTGLTEMTIPNDITRISNNTFEGCSGLIKVTIGERVASIGSGAFTGCKKIIEVCNLSSLNIDNGYGIFGFGTLNIYSADKGQSKIFETDHGYIFYLDAEVNYLVGYKGAKTQLILPDGVGDEKRSYEIYKNAFKDSSELTSVTMTDAVVYIGSCAFENCGRLTDIYFNRTLSQWKAINKYSDWDLGTRKYTVHCTDVHFTPYS